MLLIVVIGIVAGVADSKNPNKPSAENEPRPAASTVSFQAYVSTEMKEYDGIELEVFTVQMQGAIKAPMNNCPVFKTITLYDITGGRDDQKPVLCSLDNLQYQNTTAFYSSSMDTLPFMMSLLADWQPLLSIPVETLTFPARGKRVLLFTVSMTALNGTVLVGAQSEVFFVNNQPGYLDNMKSRLRVAELAVKLAVSVSAADGSFAGTEGRVVKDWIQKRIASSVDSQKQEAKQKLNNAVEVAMIASGSADPEDIIHFCNDLIEMNPIPAASMGDKYDVLELCLKVASADGTAKDIELELVYSLAESLGVDRDRFRTMIDKILPVNIHETENVNTILGLEQSWTVEQKRKHLRQENRKWRAMATHSNPEKQAQGRQMQDLIAKEMALLENSDETV